MLKVLIFTYTTFSINANKSQNNNKHANVLLFITHYKYIKTFKPTLNEKLITSLFNNIKINIFWISFLCLNPKNPENYTFSPILPIHFHICLPSNMRSKGSKHLMFLFTFCRDVSEKSIYWFHINNSSKMAVSSVALSSQWY